MNQTRTVMALFTAFLLGIMATSFVSGCQQAASPTTAQSNTTTPDSSPSSDSSPAITTDADSSKLTELTAETSSEEKKSDAPKANESETDTKDTVEKADAVAPAKTSGPESKEKGSSQDSAKSGDNKEAAPSDKPEKIAVASSPENNKDTDDKKATDDKKETEDKKDAGQTESGQKSDAVDAEVKKGGARGSAPNVDKSANAKLVPGDWAQWGGSGYRNNTPIAKNIPIQWEVGEMDRETGKWSGQENVRWVSQLGSQTYGNPVIANGHVYVGTNNGAGYLKRYPGEVDLGVLLSFNEKDGKFEWQDSSEKLPTGRVHDWPLQGICCAPYVEGNRLWYVTSRGEVVCLDAEGFHDNEDDGPVKNTLGRLFDVAQNEDPEKDKLVGFVSALNEGKIAPELGQQFAERGMPLGENAKVTAETGGKKWSITATVNGAERQMQISLVGLAPGQRLNVFKVISPADKDEADRIWVFDMMKELRVSQHNMCSCSVTALGDLLFVNTSNGVDETHINIPQEEAPSFICLDKNTGKVYWTTNEPGVNVLHGQWSSPAVAELGGVPQVIFGAGDGWVYSYKADKGKDGKPELLWEFDANPKETKYSVDARSQRNHVIATPVVYDGLVYVGVGEDPEHGEGEGHFWCIDPTLRGDVSPQLAVTLADRTKKLPKRRMQAVVSTQGEIAIDNPNSAAVWHFHKYDTNGDGKISFDETMHRTCGTAAISKDLVFVADFSGLFHCLDAKSGKVHWTYDMLAASWASPLVVEDKVYITDEDGDVAVFNVTAEKHEPLAETNMSTSIYTTPVVANDTLFIANRTHLFAIDAKSADGEKDADKKKGADKE